MSFAWSAPLLRARTLLAGAFVNGPRAARQRRGERTGTLVPEDVHASPLDPEDVPDRAARGLPGKGRSPAACAGNSWNPEEAKVCDGARRADHVRPQLVRQAALGALRGLIQRHVRDAGRLGATDRLRRE